MNDAEFQRLLNAEPPIALRPGWVESLGFRRLSSLILNRDYFMVTIPFSIRRYSWRDVSAFHDDNVGYGLVRGVSEKKVFFECRLPNKATFMDKLFFIKSVWLPYTYGLTALQLAQLMNHWRERAITDKSY